MPRRALVAFLFLIYGLPAAPLIAQTEVAEAERELALELARLADDEARERLLADQAAGEDRLAAGLARLELARRAADRGALEDMAGEMEEGLAALLASGASGREDRAAAALLAAAREHAVRVGGEARARKLLARAAGLELGLERAAEVAFLAARFSPDEERDGAYERVARERAGTEGARRALFERAQLAAAWPVDFDHEFDPSLSGVGFGSVPLPGESYREARRRFAEAMAAGEGTAWPERACATADKDAARRAEKEYLHSVTSSGAVPVAQLADPRERLSLVRPEKDPVVYRLYREEVGIEEAFEALFGKSAYEARSDGEAIHVSTDPAEVSLEIPGPGLFLLEVESATYLAVQRIACSTARASVRAGEGKVVLFVADRAGAPWPGAEVFGRLVLHFHDDYDHEGQDLEVPATGITCASGLLELAPEIPEGAARVTYELAVRAGEGYLATEGEFGPAAPRSPATSAYLFSDRPLYRPGEKASVKGVVRVWDGARFLSPEGANYRLTIHPRYAGNEPVFQADVTTGPHGSFHLDWPIAATARPGLYVARLADGEKALVTIRLARVEEFRPPEVHLEVKSDRESYAPGDTVRLEVVARYHFGGAAGGLAGRLFLGERSFPFVTDGEGMASVELPASASLARNTIRAQVADSGGRVVMSEAIRLSIGGTPAGATRVLAQPVSPVVRAKDGIRLVVRGVDAHGGPASWAGTLLLLPQGSEHPVARRRVEAGPEPVIVHFSVEKGGTYEVVAESDLPREVLARVRVAPARVEELGEGGAKLLLSPDRSRYRLGDVARIAIEGDPGARVLVTVESDRVEIERLVLLDEGLAELEIPIGERGIPSLAVTGSYPFAGGVKARQAWLQVEDPSRVLTVEVTPDRPAYRPGEEALFAIAVRDPEGRPVSAEISIGVVDRAIYDLQEDLAPSLVRWFREPDRRVAGEPKAAFEPGDPTKLLRELFMFDADGTAIGLGSFRGRFGGKRNLIAMGGGAGSTETRGGVVPRSDFRYTAYWHPAVVTDDQGRASVRFRFPDGLTSWRATARVFARGARAGMVRVETATSLPLWVRSRHPRFFRRGDEILLPALVRNEGGADLAAKVSIQVEGIKLLDSAERDVEVPAGGEANVFWKVRVPDQGPAEARITFRVEGGGESDGEEVHVPVLDHARAVRYARSGTARDLVQVELPPFSPDERPSGRLVLSPGPAAAIAEALRYLEGYPYGCVEQTMSRFLPAVAALAAREKLGLTNDVLDANLEEMIEASLGRLAALRHGDGGWGWWSADATDLWMTAYVRFGLEVLEKHGIDLASRGLSTSPLDSFSRELLDLLGDPGVVRALTLPRPEDPDARGGWDESRARLAERGVRPDESGLPAVLFWLAALARETAFEPTLLEPYLAAWDGLSPALRAVLVLALAELGAGEEARARLDALLSSGTLDPASGVRTWGYDRDRRWWMDAPHTAALVLLAANRALPDDPRNEEVALGLLALRSGGRWSSTRDTSLAVLALAGHLAVRGGEASAGPVRYEVRHGNRLLAEGALDAGAPGATIELSPDLLGGGGPLSIETRDGPLFYDLSIDRLATGESLPPESNVLALERRFERVGFGPFGERVVEPIEPGAIVRPGEKIRVRLLLRTPVDLEHVLVEDPRGSGFETVLAWSGPFSLPRDFRSTGPSPAEVELRDDRASFFLPFVPAGETEFAYEVVPSVEGEIHVLAARAEAMYAPTIAATSEEFRVQVARRAGRDPALSRLVLDDDFFDRLSRGVLAELAGARPDRVAALLDVLSGIPEIASRWDELVRPALLALDRDVLLDPEVSRRTVSLFVSARPLASRENLDRFLEWLADPGAKCEALARTADLDMRWTLYSHAAARLSREDRMPWVEALACATEFEVGPDGVIEFLAREEDPALRLHFLVSMFPAAPRLTWTSDWPDDKERVRREEAIGRALDRCRSETDEKLYLALLAYLSRFDRYSPLQEYAAERYPLAACAREKKLLEGLFPRDEAARAAQGGLRAVVELVLPKIAGEPEGREVLRIARVHGEHDLPPPARLSREEPLRAVDALPLVELANELGTVRSYRHGWFLARALGRRPAEELARALPADDEYALAARGLAGDKTVGPALVRLLAVEMSDEGRDVLWRAIESSATGEILAELRALDIKGFEAWRLEAVEARVAAESSDETLVRFLEGRTDSRVLSSLPGYSERAAFLVAGRYLAGEWGGTDVRKYLDRDRELSARLVATLYRADRPFAWRLRAVLYAGALAQAAREDPHPAIRELATPREHLADRVRVEGLWAARRALEDPNPAHRLEAARVLYEVAAELATYEDAQGALVRYLP